METNRRIRTKDLAKKPIRQLILKIQKKKAFNRN